MKIIVEDSGRTIYQSGDGKTLFPRDKKEVERLIKKLNHNITFLKGVSAAMDENLEIESGEKTLYDKFYNNVDVIAKTKTVNGTRLSTVASSFVGGLSALKFELGKDFDKDKKISSNTLRFVSITDIYYDGKLIVSKGGNAPYFHQVQTWSTDHFEGNVANVNIDLRPAGVYGTDFNPEFISDEKGNKGHLCALTFMPVYEIPE